MGGLLVSTAAWAQNAAEQVFPARLAAHSLILDVIKAGNRYVAVGERGHVLLSDDGAEWRQAVDVPTRATLTAVYFRGGQLWAVGHDSVVLSSADMGETWVLQYSDPEAEQPLMDVLFLDTDRGIAVGAYSLYMHTEDGGAHWEVGTMGDFLAEGSDTADAMDEDVEFDDADVEGSDGDGLDGEEDDEFAEDVIEYHLNAILDLGDEHLLIAAESGNGYRSEDGGESWHHFEFPYPGSMFGLIRETEAGDCVLAYGLRGHIQRGCGFGDDWREVENSSQASLFGAAYDGQRVVLVGANGALVHVVPGAVQAQAGRLASGEDLAAAVTTAHGVVVAGEDGLSMAGEMAAEDDAHEGEQP